jgi:hypothetical protein
MEKRYDFRDANGERLYSVVKYPGKNFRRVRYDADGQEVWNWEGITQVPYNLDKIVDKEAVFFVEGEKDCDNLTKIGYPATTIAGGSNAVGPLIKAQPDFFKKYFSIYKFVLIIPDNDLPGKKFMDDVAQQISPHTKVFSCELPGLAVGGDVTDFLDAEGYSTERFKDTIERCQKPWEPPEVPFTDALYKPTTEKRNLSPLKSRVGVPRDIQSVYNKIRSERPGVMSGEVFNCRCPAHADKKASLSITLREDRILMFCHAGCHMRDICKAMGIEPYQLFESSKAELETRQRTPVGPRPEELKRICNDILDKKQPEEFDDSLMPDILKDYVRECAEITEANPIIIYSTALSALGAHAGTKLLVAQPDYFVRLYGNLWSLSISESGSYKTTALNVGAANLRDREGDILSQTAELRSQIELMVDNGAGEDDDELMNYRNDLERFEEMRRVLPNKASWEACLHRIGRTGGGLWLLSEFGAWLSSLETQHNKGLRQTLTELYDVPRFFEELTIGRGARVLEYPFVSIAGVSTLEFLQGLLGRDDAGSGFLARFLLFRPPVKQSTPDALPVSKTRIEDTNPYRLLSEVYRQLEYTTVPVEYTLTSSAKQVFEEYHKGLFERFHKTDESLQSTLDSFLKRWSPGAIKVAILCQYLIDSHAKEIGDAAMTAGVSMLLYAEQSTRLLFDGELGESDHQAKQRRLIDYIAKKGGKIARSKLITSKVLGGGVAEYNYILDTLEAGQQVAITRLDGKVTGQSDILLTSNKDGDIG